jgi:hypothetical protein
VLRQTVGREQVGQASWRGHLGQDKVGGQPWQERYNRKVGKEKKRTARTGQLRQTTEARKPGKDT